MKNIRAIIFDFGGVLSTHDDLGDIGRHLAKKYHITEKRVDDITWQGWKNARLNPKYDAKFWRNLAQALGISQKQLRTEYLTFPRFLPEVAELARTLKKKYVVGMLSNQISSWHRALMKQWKLHGIFRPIVTSYGEGVAKPDVKIYKRLLKKLHVPANECVYIEDRESNLIPAQQLGMHPILFKTPKQLIRELKKFGVEL